MINLWGKFYNSEKIQGDIWMLCCLFGYLYTRASQRLTDPRTQPSSEAKTT